METSYTKKLLDSAQKHGSLLCFGLDPVLEKIPASIKGSTRERILKFYTSILDVMPERGGLAALKPNYAFFAQYGWDGLQALSDLIIRYYGRYPIILDVKRSDIGNTASAYAKEGFEFWGADALTVSPFLGADSVKPFLDYCPQGKGVYLLCRTSNAGAADFQGQMLQESGQPLYMRVLDKALEWHQDGLGLVVGATAPAELDAVLKTLQASGKAVPLLIPGVGTQGGSAEGVGRLLRKAGAEQMGLHRINASSSIAFAYLKKTEGADYVDAAIEEIMRLNKAIGF
jgi:orotidine-5'-phosphate decarboxylase